MLNLLRFLIPTYRDKQIRQRLEALDILRAFAIFLVFMWHYPEAAFAPIGAVGWTGVDLFFLLSGYLIGNQIFSALRKRHDFSLKSFWYRRLFRTLPNYWFVLALYFLIPGFQEWHEPMSAPFWKFITFTQNFGLESGAFSNAWSLCIEEQFYLVLPLIFLWAVRKTESLRPIWIGILLVVIFETFLRAGLWLHYIKEINDPSQKFMTYMTQIYYPTYTRLYGLLFGVTIALIKNYHATAWEKLTAKGNLIFILGLFGTMISFYLYRNPFFMVNFYSTVFAYPLLDLSFALLVIAAVSPKSFFYHLHIPGATIIASWSYAMYLLQKPVISLTNDALAHFNIAKTSLIAIVTAIFFTLFASWLLYTLIETPFLKFRDRKKFFV